MERTSLPSRGATVMTEEQLIAKERAMHPYTCIRCDFCDFELDEDEIEEQEIDQDHEGICRRYPPSPDSGSPEVELFQKKCGEFKEC